MEASSTEWREGDPGQAELGAEELDSQALSSSPRWSGLVEKPLSESRRSQLAADEAIFGSDPTDHESTTTHDAVLVYRPSYFQVDQSNNDMPTPLPMPRWADKFDPLQRYLNGYVADSDRIR